MRYAERRAEWSVLRGSHRRGFSPVGFIVLIALTIGFLGPTNAGFLFGLVLGLIAAGWIARTMGSGHRRTVVAVPPRLSVAGAAPHPTCYCGSDTHNTEDHQATGPHTLQQETLFQKAIEEAFKTGKMSVRVR